jgi:hypothetical protein
MLKDKTSKLYTYLEIIGYGQASEEIKKMKGGLSDAEFAGKAEVILKDKVIKPFKLDKYADFEISTIDQIRKVPKDMQDQILTLVGEKSYEGLFYPWLDLAAPEVHGKKINTESWDGFLGSVGFVAVGGSKGAKDEDSYKRVEDISASEIDDFLDNL